MDDDQENNQRKKIALKLFRKKGKDYSFVPTVRFPDQFVYVEVVYKNN